MMEQAATRLAVVEAEWRELRVEAQRSHFLLVCAFHTLKDMADISHGMRQWDVADAPTLWAASP